MVSRRTGHEETHVQYGEVYWAKHSSKYRNNNHPKQTLVQRRSVHVFYYTEEVKLTGINKYFLGVLGGLVCLTLNFSTPAFAQEIILRHALDGKAQDALATLVLRFNDHIKGQGRVILQDVRSLDNKRPLPLLALLNADDSMNFFTARITFMPLHTLMRNYGQPLNTSLFYPQMLDAVADSTGQPQALPMGMSLPVLLINRGQVPRAAKTIDLSPRTWLDVQNLAGTLSDNGVKCPLTSSRFAWVHLENTASQHGEQMDIRTGRSEKVKANNLMNVKHLALLASWQKSHYFTYFGPDAEANQRFLQGECAMITGESALYVAARATGMDVTLAPLPYYDDAYGAQREKVLPDGAALWVLPGQPKAAYALAARFVSYLLQPDVQRDWVRASGSLPMTPGALAALRESGMPAALADAAEQRLAASRADSTRIHPGALRDRLHLALDEQVALVWSTPRSAKQALDTATLRANSPSSGGSKTKAARRRK
ncbi:extracellular solute-binding protein [Rugosibacter aromaticivorans]|uniref:extracellular solute-binding protein n=1 Tax=Rugosibacter aromaticivorans TaxID=1565605 RepID=UPI00121A8E6E|nr:extracellular solute-binding protein [Rugosibacter aromaticivorans]TBR15524.1 MAG: extracellular solute-binding protein [Rugosibacter sp.]